MSESECSYKSCTQYISIRVSRLKGGNQHGEWLMVVTEVVMAALIMVMSVTLSAHQKHFS